MRLCVLGFHVHIERGFLKDRGIGMILPTKEEAAYQRGYEHGVNSERAKCFHALVYATEEARVWRSKYKGEFGRACRMIDDMRRFLTFDEWREVNGGPVAQSAEQGAHNPQRPGSIPGGPTVDPGQGDDNA